MIARLLPIVGLWSLLGLLTGASITALLGLAYGKPIEGAAVITLYLIPAAFGGLLGACKDY